MRMKIDYLQTSYGNLSVDAPVDVTISTSPYGPFDTTLINFKFSKETTTKGLLGGVRLHSGLLELPTEDARKLATAILWHLEQPKRKVMRLKFKEQNWGDDDNAD